jgi:hypothetical protein
MVAKSHADIVMPTDMTWLLNTSFLAVAKSMDSLVEQVLRHWGHHMRGSLDI